MSEAKSFEQMMEESDRVLRKYANLKQQVQNIQILAESLDQNGASQTLQVLASLSTTESDPRIDSMLAMLPAMVAIQKFFKKIPSYEVDAADFEYLIKQGVHFI